MTTFTNSRLNTMNMRERKPLNLTGEPSGNELINTHSQTIIPSQQESQGLKLTLPEVNTYQPTNSFTSSRTQMRMLKVKLDKGPNSNNPQRTSLHGQDNGNAFTKTPLNSTEMNHTFKPKPDLKKLQLNNNETSNDFKPMINRPPLPQSGMKLVLPDESGFAVKQEKKNLAFSQPGQSKETLSKRILISDDKRGDSRQKKINIQQSPDKKPIVEPVVVPLKTAQINDEAPIQPKQINSDAGMENPGSEEDAIQNENQLVECPEGCGRKFNAKALQTHAKACKIVFMSKRKEFNSQAKRVLNKEQANLTKQAKQKEKKQLIGTTKIEKTGEAWKTQSEGFRAVVKALKQQQVKVNEDQDVKVVTCQFCEKKFNEIIYQKHLLICEVKKEKEKKLAKKGSKKQ